MLKLFIFIFLFSNALVGAEERPVKRLELWRAQGLVRVFIPSADRDLVSAFEEVREEVKGFIPIPVIRVYSRWDSDILLGFYTQSAYFHTLNEEAGFYEMHAVAHFISSFIGFTLLYDRNYKTQLTPDYNDSEYVYTESLISNPHVIKEYAEHIEFFGLSSGRAQKDKIALTIKKYAKHELYHALGLYHNSYRLNPFISNTCHIMDNTADKQCLYPSGLELIELITAWKGKKNEP